MRKIVKAAAIFVIASAANARAGWNPSTSFSVGSNPNGVWTYGWSQTLASAFTVDTLNQNSSGVEGWFGGVNGIGGPYYPAISYNNSGSTVNSPTNTLPAGQLAQHPGPNGEYSVLRFTTPAANGYTLTAQFTGLDFGGPTSTDVHILVDGTSVFDGLVNTYNGGPSYSHSFQLNAGDTVDFAVGYGSNHTYNEDSTGLTANIAIAPEVASSTLALGSVGLLVRRRRRRVACPRR